MTTPLRKNQTGQPTTNGGQFAKATPRPEGGEVLARGAKIAEFKSIAAAAASRKFRDLDEAIDIGEVDSYSVAAMAETTALDIVGTYGIDVTDPRVKQVARESAEYVTENNAAGFGDLHHVPSFRNISPDQVHDILVTAGIEALDRIDNGMKFGADADSKDDLLGGFTHIGREGRDVQEIIVDKGRHIDWSSEDSARIKTEYKQSDSAEHRELLERVFPVEASEAEEEMAEL
jgi:hypothetical protein